MKRTATTAGVPRSRAKRTREQRDNPYPYPYSARPTPKQRRDWRETKKGVRSFARQRAQEMFSQARRHT